MAQIEDFFMNHLDQARISLAKAKHMGIFLLSEQVGEQNLTFGMTPLLSLPIEEKSEKPDVVYMLDAEDFYQRALKQNHPNLVAIKRIRDDVKLLNFIEKRQSHQDQVMKTFDQLDEAQQKIVLEDQDILNQLAERHGKRVSFDELVNQSKSKTISPKPK